MRPYLLTAAMLLFIISGCAGIDTGTAKMTPAGSMFVNGEVVSSEGIQAIVKAYLADENSGIDIEKDFAVKVLNMTYLTQDSETKINGKDYKVKERRGDSLILQGPPGLKPGQKIQLFVPKKTMIISDLAVKERSNNSVTGNITFDNLKREIINSGRYAVVERDKLAAILQEHKLELSGLTDPDQASFVGKILKAEILLSGDMTKAGAHCIFDIKAIDIATSRIIGNIHEGYLCSKITQNLDIRSVEKNLGTFEQGNESGWMLGRVPTAPGFTTPDFATGANGTKASLKHQVNHNAKVSSMLNKLLRDVSGFEGVTFYAKADREMIISFVMIDADKNGKLEEGGKWVKPLFITTDWVKYDIKIADLVPSGLKTKMFKTEDRQFTPEQIEQIRISAVQELNKTSLEGAVFWVDELTLY